MVFSRPVQLSQLPRVAAILEARLTDHRVVVRTNLWAAFRDLSLWIEALAIHEWCLFTEGLRVSASGVGEDLQPAGRGDVYCLLTDHPDTG